MEDIVSLFCSTYLHEYRTPEGVQANTDWHYAFPDYPAAYDIHRFYAIRESWLYRLLALRGVSEASRPAKANIATFTEFLIRGQRHDTEPMMKNGSWAIPLDVQMPSDARVEFVYFPSYIAVAWLSLVRQDHPEVADEVAGIESTLSDGLKFASYRNLDGHGYEGNQQCLDTIEILSLGKVFTLMLNRPRLSRTFDLAIQKAVDRIVRNMPNETGWSGTDPKRRERALALVAGDDDDSENPDKLQQIQNDLF